MSAQEYRAYAAAQGTGKAKTPAAPAASPVPAKTRQKAALPPAPTAKETAARAEVATVGRYVGQYTGFGLTQPYRKYVLLDAEQAAALDRAFCEITGVTIP